MKIDKACEKWLERQRKTYKKLADECSASILEIELLAKLEFILLIQGFIKDGVVEVKDDLSDSVFIKHIQKHLKPNEEVVCKICGKTAKEIIKENESR